MHKCNMCCKKDCFLYIKKCAAAELFMFYFLF